MKTALFTDLDPDVYKTIVVLFFLVLIMRFILMIINKFLDHKIKNRIIDKGLSNEFAAALLQTEKTNELANSIKWFLLLLSTGIGLFVTTKVLPLGIHSIAIIAISISLGFLTYSFYLKTNNK